MYVGLITKISNTVTNMPILRKRVLTPILHLFAVFLGANFGLLLHGGVPVMKVGVKWPKVWYSKWWASMADAFEAIIWTFCLKMVSDRSLRNEICTLINYLSKVRAFKVYLKFCISKFWPPLESNYMWARSCKNVSYACFYCSLIR